MQRIIEVKTNRLDFCDNPEPQWDWKYCYGRIRRWLRENKRRCQGDIVVLQSGESPRWSGYNGLRDIDELPPVGRVKKKEAALLFRKVIRGCYEWAHWQHDGQFCMRDYAIEAEKHADMKHLHAEADAITTDTLRTKN